MKTDLETFKEFAHLMGYIPREGAYDNEIIVFYNDYYSNLNYTFRKVQEAKTLGFKKGVKVKVNIHSDENSKLQTEKTFEILRGEINIDTSNKNVYFGDTIICSNYIWSEIID